MNPNYMRRTATRSAFIPASQRLTRVEKQSRERMAYAILILCFMLSILGGLYGAAIGDKWAMVYYTIPGLALLVLELVIVAKTNWLEVR